MRHSQLTYGNADEVADFLGGDGGAGIGVDHLQAALINALNRIARLEARLAKMEERASERTKQA